MPLRLPHLNNAHRYAGLYVYDFGDHVAVGYTAAEIMVLKDSVAHREGATYQIYRVIDNAEFHLRGVDERWITQQEAMIFLHSDPAVARGDFSRLRAAADAAAVPCHCAVELANVYDFQPPHAVALIYPSAVSHLLSGWLAGVAVKLGDKVLSGVEALHQFRQASIMGLAVANLPGLMDYADRPAAEVLAHVGDPVQRG